MYATVVPIYMIALISERMRKHKPATNIVGVSVLETYTGWIETMTELRVNVIPESECGVYVTGNRVDPFCYRDESGRMVLSWKFIASHSLLRETSTLKNTTRNSSSIRLPTVVRNLASALIGMMSP